MPAEDPSASTEARCSCGARYVRVTGEFHDCAIERGVALEIRKAEALERIAASLERFANFTVYGAVT